MTSQDKPFELPERNPVTYAKHRKEVFWQITFPLIIGGLLVVAAIVALVVMTVNESRLQQALPLPENTARLGDVSAEDVAMLRYQKDTTARLSNVSQMWLVMPVLFFALVTLAVLVGLIYVCTKLLGVTPGYMRLAQDYLTIASWRVHKALDAAVEPVMRVKSFNASVRQTKVTALQQLSDLLGKIAGVRTE